MSSLKSFFKKNKKGAETHEVSLPNFEEAIQFRVLTAREVDAINDRCFTTKTGRNGRQEKVFDGTRYNRELCVASIIYPDLNDKALQESYGAMGAQELYGEMFNWGENALILEAITEASGLNTSVNDKIEEAKN